MQSIETLALQTYENNIAYFKKSQQKLFEMINVLNLAIEKGDYTPRYDLEYLKDYFDVKELATGNYLYATSSSKVSKEFASIVNFKKNSYTYEGLPVYRSTDIQDRDSDKGRGLEGIYPIMDYYLDHTSDTDSMKSIEKFIFVGVALGFHISEIAKRVESKYYLIIEDDLELFRLSLFTTDYAGLARKSALYFAIADDDNLFLKTINPFLENAFFDNRYLKYAHFPTHSTNKLKQIQNAILSQNFISFHYKTELYKYLRPLEYLNDGYKVLNLSRHIKNDLLYSKPVLLITAGPSLEKNIEWLKENHERFIIMAVSATLKTLYKYGIKPTILTHVDGFSTSMKHYENIPVEEFLKNTLVILGPFADSLLKKLFRKEQLYYFEEETEYIRDFGSISAPCVGSFSLLLGLILNTKEFYLLGLDFAVDQKTGSTHTSGHAHSEEVDMMKKDEVSDTMSLRENLLPVQGNFEPKVYTNTLFNFSLQSLQNNILKVKREDQEVYNLNDGAYIYATTPTKITEVDVNNYEKLDKDKIAKELKATLDKHSVTQLNDADMDSLQKRLEYSLEIKSKIEEYSKGVSKTSPENFMADLLGVVSSIVKVRNRETNNIVQVYYSYFKHVLPIVFDLFNTQGLKNKKQHIKRLNEMITKEMINIEGIYSQRLSSFLSGEKDKVKERETSFMLSLYEEIDVEKLRSMRSNNHTLSFFINEKILEDEIFLSYIKELYTLREKVLFCIYYFDETYLEEFQLIFKEHLSRFRFMIPKDIYDVAESSDVYIMSGKVYAHDKLFLKLREFSNIPTIQHTPVLKDVSLKSSLEPMSKALREATLLRWNSLGYSKEDIEKASNSIHYLIYKPYLPSLTLDTNMYDFMYKDLLYALLRDDKAREAYVEYYRKEIIYLEKNRLI